MLGIPDAGNVWLWLGMHPKVKGLDRVLLALGENKSAHLLIGGLDAGHPKARQSRRLIRDLGLIDRVTFLGYLAGERYSAALATADVLAHPARKEAAGMTILEAIVNGLPVVATDICGFAGHIEKSGAGIVRPSPFNQRAFAEALDSACGLRSEEFSRRGIEYGTDPRLYSGIDVACDLIEATEWSALSLNGLND
jgi:UDP-glucose:(heptosyl)LPS alpha-1,3-glucosyltransferase